MTNDRLLDYVGDDFLFLAWLNEVDRYIENQLGLSLMDLADRNYRDEYDGGVSPLVCALTTLREEGYSDDELR